MHFTHAQLSADGEKSADTLFSFYLRNPQVCKESVWLKPETSALFGSEGEFFGHTEENRRGVKILANNDIILCSVFLCLFSRSF